MADSDQVDSSKVIPAVPVIESDAVKALQSVIDALGDSMSVSDREKYDGLIARAREASNA